MRATKLVDGAGFNGKDAPAVPGEPCCIAVDRPTRRVRLRRASCGALKNGRSVLGVPAVQAVQGVVGSPSRWKSVPIMRPREDAAMSRTLSESPRTYDRRGRVRTEVTKLGIRISAWELATLALVAPSAAAASGAGPPGGAAGSVEEGASGDVGAGRGARLQARAERSRTK
jgi:hypothetical protein